MAVDAANLALIEGARPVIEAIRAKRRIVRAVVLPDGDGSAARRELETLLSGCSIERREAKRGEGIHAFADPYPEEEFEALLAAPSPRFLVALDRVTDVGNLGSIARTAEGAGVLGLVLEHRRAPPIAAGALRASAGALEHLRVGRTPNLARAVELARSEGLVVLVADAGGRSLEDLPAALLTSDLLWIFGSEDLGARESIRRNATATVGIPLRGKVGSLGVAAAAAYLVLRTAELRLGAKIAGRAETS
ncbi:MAG TPA: RNA methyltransferase [Myxococcota bacterium]|nr:RNA methyltransferase [Myxococcota bacterium]